jgi:hypothetical protein
MQHTMNLPALEQRRTRFDTALLVLTVTPIPPRPRVCALQHPECRQRGEALYALWTCLHREAPPGPLRGHPGVQRLGVGLLSRPDRHATRSGLGRDVAPQEWGWHAIRAPGPGEEHGEPPSHWIAPPMALAPLDCFATGRPPLGASHRGGLDGLTGEARDTGGGLTSRCYARAFAQARDPRGPGPGIAPWRQIVLNRALGPQSRRQHVPWTPAPGQRKKRVEACPPVDLPRVPSAWPRLGRWEQRCHDGPWCVRES